MGLPQIETERLQLRPFRAADWPAVYAYTSDPAVMTWIPEGVFSEAQAQEFVGRQQGEQAQALALLRRETGALIGHMIFHPWFAPRTYEIGWVLHPAHHGRGYATEAAQALLRHAFETLAAHRVIATCQPENPASYRVMEKIGMRREGHFRRCIHRGGDTWWDEYFYAILATEWLPPDQPPAPRPARLR